MPPSGEKKIVNMSGIILLLILTTWFFVVKKLTGLCTSSMQLGNKKILTCRILFVLFFIAPVTDEIIGGFQFRALCTPNNLLSYDKENINGKTVQIQSEFSDSRLINKIIPIQEYIRTWVDSETGDILITHRMYYAKGGWLSRLIKIPDSGNTIIFYGHCDSKEYYELFEKLNIKKIEIPYGEKR